MPYQYGNQANPHAHYNGTAPEILEELDEITAFVAGLGTGGTLMGVGRRLREELGDAVKIVAAEPMQGEPVQGLRSLDDGFIPPIIDLSLLDRKIFVTNRDAIVWTRKLLDEEGIFAGVSSGAIASIAVRIANELDEGNVVFIVCDDGWKYLSSGLYTTPGGRAREPGLHRLVVTRAARCSAPARLVLLAGCGKPESTRGRRRDAVLRRAAARRRRRVVAAYEGVDGRWRSPRWRARARARRLAAGRAGARGRQPPPAAGAPGSRRALAAERARAAGARRRRSARSRDRESRELLGGADRRRRREPGRARGAARRATRSPTAFPGEPRDEAPPRSPARAAPRSPRRRSAALAAAAPTRAAPARPVAARDGRPLAYGRQARAASRCVVTLRGHEADHAAALATELAAVGLGTPRAAAVRRRPRQRRRAARARPARRRRRRRPIALEEELVDALPAARCRRCRTRRSR